MHNWRTHCHGQFTRVPVHKRSSQFESQHHPISYAIAYPLCLCNQRMQPYSCRIRRWKIDCSGCWQASRDAFRSTFSKILGIQQAAQPDFIWRNGI
ncbi:neurobeachin like 1 [Phyllostomus discolor]|uniref:Neurobeachin like 1 n=1 Tax=Phyllostomus discolor TaxID=89673 RepID=A0A834ASM9_9CHIR|nr:neurobeachin like 1 [Phyllostomus discolor]